MKESKLSTMSEDKVIQNDEKVFPVFYKKKVLPLKKTKELQEMMKELMQENEETMTHEKVMLDKIREKDNKFIKRLEDNLESFKMAGIEKIVLKQDFLPVWPQETKSDTVDDHLPAIDDDTTDRLVEWYKTMTTYVDLQHDKVKPIINDWFSQLDKIANEGEPDPRITGKIYGRKKVVDSETSWGNIFWYIGFFLICATYVFIYYNPENARQCVDDGFYECFVPIPMKICAFVRDSYLKFHNITLDDPIIALENSSIADIAQYSSETEFSIGLKFHNITQDDPIIALENSSITDIVQYSSKTELSVLFDNITYQD